MSRTANDRLRAAANEGPAALIALIAIEQATRLRNAEKWQQYALFRPVHSRTYTHVVTPQGRRYRLEERDGMPVFIGSGDTDFTERVNREAARLGIPNRLVAKHVRVAHEIEEAVLRGERVWDRCPPEGVWPAGWITVPTPAVPAAVTVTLPTVGRNDFAVARPVRARVLVGCTGEGG